MGVGDRVRDFLTMTRPTSQLPVMPTSAFTDSRTVEPPPLVSRQYADTTASDSAFIWISSLANLNDRLAPWGNLRREAELRTLWKQDSMLSGAVASMTQKMISLGFSLTGRRNQTRRMSKLLAFANDGRGWYDYVAKGTQDFLTQDKGWFTELGRESVDSYAVEGIWTIDAQYMIPRHDREYPWYYNSPNGRPVKVPWTDVMQSTSMPSPIELMNSLGFCAVSRAAKAAQLLIALYNYDAEKLSNMPPQGIASISGMTEKQVMDALKKYRASLDQREALIYPGVLWLASMSGQINVNLTPFSTLPDSFSRQEVIQIYVYTLALDFGVDAREFWPAAIAGATRADALVQAMKAKGKGPGELISVVERGLNNRVMPEGTRFKFDFTDDEEDSLRAEMDLTRIRGIVELYGNSARYTQDPLISKEEGREILARLGIIPRAMALPEPTETLITDIGGFRAQAEPEVVIEYRDGVLEETDMTRSYYIFGRGFKNGHKPLDSLTEVEQSVRKASEIE